jgi:hypothetical protein
MSVYMKYATTFDCMTCIGMSQRVSVLCNIYAHVLYAAYKTACLYVCVYIQVLIQQLTS